VAGRIDEKCDTHPLQCIDLVTLRLTPGEGGKLLAVKKYAAHDCLDSMISPARKFFVELALAGPERTILMQRLTID
jgi:hypothetical protein